jgi:hypothetical protein
LRALTKLLSGQGLPKETKLWILDSSKFEIDVPCNKEN